MRKKRFADKSLIQKIALERVYRLFDVCEENKEDEGYTKRLVKLARKIGERNRVKIPRELKERFCKNCNAYLIIGKNARKRIKRKTVVITCLECNSVRKIKVI